MQSETSYPAIVGRILEHLRKEKDFDQSRVAEHMGLTQSAWSRIERGQSGISMEQLIKIGNLLGVRPHQIIENADVAMSDLEGQGVVVHPQVISKPSNTMAMLGLAALGLMIAAILSKK